MVLSTAAKLMICVHTHVSSVLRLRKAFVLKRMHVAGAWPAHVRF